MRWKQRAAAISVLVTCASAVAAQACGSQSFQGQDGDASTDGSEEVDGAPSDAASADAGSGSCMTQAPQAFFCADFDESDPRTAFELGQSVSAFEYASVSDSGTFAIDGGGESPPNAAEAYLPELPDGSIEHGTVSATLPTASGAARFTLHAHLRFDSYGDISTQGNLTLLTLSIKDLTTNAKEDYDVYVSNGTVQMRVTAGAVPTVVSLGGVPSAGDAWIPLVIDVLPAGNVNAQLGTGVKGSTASGLLGGQNRATITVGLTSVDGTPFMGVSFDDIVLDVDHGDGGLEFSDGAIVSSDGG